MARIPGSVTSRFYRQGTAYAVGAIVDGFISGEETKVLYEKWNESWGVPLQFQGGVKAITCQMILDAPDAELRKAYGKKMADQLLDVSKTNA